MESTSILSTQQVVKLHLHDEEQKGKRRITTGDAALLMTLQNLKNQIREAKDKVASEAVAASTPFFMGSVASAPTGASLSTDASSKTTGPGTVVTVPPATTGTNNPSTLPPNLWALEILGVTSLYDQLLKAGGATPTPAVAAQIKACADWITQSAENEATYEAAHNGKTYADATIANFLKNANGHLGYAHFSSWMGMTMTGGAAHPFGPGPDPKNPTKDPKYLTVVDWLVSKETDLLNPTGPGNLPDWDASSPAEKAEYNTAMGLIFAFWAELDSHAAGKIAGKVDNLWWDGDPQDPGSGNFMQASAQAFAFYMHSQGVDPSMAATFTTAFSTIKNTWYTYELNTYFKPYMTNYAAGNPPLYVPNDPYSQTWDAADTDSVMEYTVEYFNDTWLNGEWTPPTPPPKPPSTATSTTTSGS